MFSAFDKDELSPDEEEQFSIAKHKMLGNIKFIGLWTVIIIINCIITLV